jgi:hypothetical protein
MSDVTIQVDGRSCTLTGYAPAWLYRLIQDDDTLVETRAALNRAVAGFEVELPAEETAQFCERLRHAFSGLSPAEVSGNDAQQVLALVSAVRAQPTAA